MGGGFMRNPCICILFLLALSRVAIAAVYVDQDSPGPAHDGASWDTASLTIQEGVNSSAPSGEVWVAD